MAQNMKRGRNQRRRSNTNVNRAFDSTGPDVKIRGTALQIHDKYQALARDAASAGDRIRAESLLQHAEHYHRLLKAMQPPQQQPQNDPGDSPQPDVDNSNNKDDAGASADDDKAPAAKEADTDKESADKSDSEEQSDKPRKPRRKRPSRKSADSAEKSKSCPSHRAFCFLPPSFCSAL